MGRNAGHVRRASGIFDNQAAAAQVLEGQFGCLLQGTGNVLGFTRGRERQKQGYFGVLHGGRLLGGGIIAEQIAHARHAPAACEQQDKKHGKQISPLPP